MMVKIVENKNNRATQVRVIMDKDCPELTGRYVEGHWKGEKNKLRTWVVSGHNSMHVSDKRLLEGLGLYDEDVLWYMTRFNLRDVCGGEFVVDSVIETLRG